MSLTQSPWPRQPLDLTEPLDLHEAEPPRPPRDADDRSPLLRFLDSFLQERNIKWVLGIGTAIVLGSSLMLVASHWQAYTPMWKQLIMLGYTSIIAIAGWWSYHRLALHKTGTTLMALTVLLMPVLFLGMHWVQAAAVETLALSDGMTRAGPTVAGPGLLHIAMLLVTTLMAWLAASRIFRHFLRGDQRTFVASYLILCASGVLLPLVPIAYAPLSAIILWLVCSIGAIKVNRHVFWLVEDHRAPRLVGFFPIALLAGQFLLLYALHLAPHIALPSMGFGFVLASATVLITTDTLARVFQQRTGDLVRPLPPAIVAPLIVGLLLCFAGIILAGTAIPPFGKPFALVPTAAVAAMLLLLVARRTSHPAFVWAGLIALTIAYNFSPVLFSELARQVVQSGSELVAEAKLPYAFYGLTYLPLIAGLMIAAAAARRQGAMLFARPAEQYSTFLAGLLLVISMGHAKAAAPVAAVMVGVFALQTWLYRDPRVAVLGVAAFILAAVNAVPFIEVITTASVHESVQLLVMTAAAALLLAPGYRIDRALGHMANDGAIGTCRAASRGVTVALAAWWSVSYLLPAIDGSLTLAWPWILAGIAITGLVAVHSMLRRSESLALLTIGFAYAVGLTVMLAMGLATSTALSLTLIALAMQWFAAEYSLHKTGLGVLLTFTRPALRTSEAALTGSLAFFGLLVPLGELLTTDVNPLSPWWACRCLLIAWAMVAAVRRTDRRLMTPAALSLLATSGAALIALFGGQGYEWLPALWAVIAVAAIPLLEIIRARGSEAMRVTVIKPVDRIMFVVLAVTAVLSLAVFTLPLRLAGLAALGGLLAIGVMRKSIITRVACFALINWQVIALTAFLFAPAGLTTIIGLNRATLPLIVLPVALIAAVSALIWQGIKPPKHMLTRDIIVAHRAAMGVLAGMCLAYSVTFAPGAIGLCIAAITFVLLITAQLRSACRDVSEGGVWIAEVLAGLAFAYFAWHGVISFGAGLSMFIVLAVGALLALVAKQAGRFGNACIMERPLRTTALAMPMLTVLIGIVRHFALPEPTWLGGNSLALLLAGGFYFWHGIEHGRRRFIVLAGFILNIALVLLWRELAFTDPQFFMIPLGVTMLALVRLLKNDVPTDLREPLNYLGALLILVSPTFHIVGGSWLHLFSLMLLSVLVVLGAIGFRVRPMVYTGSAFLVADLVAMIVRGSIDSPSLLWIAGIALGAAVVTLGAAAERNREQLLGRVRQVSAAIAAWD